jgi:hypothetical protein
MHGAQQPEQLREAARRRAKTKSVKPCRSSAVTGKRRLPHCGTFLPCQPRRTMLAIGLDPDTSSTSAASPVDFPKLIADDTDKWGKVIRGGNIKPE